MVRGRRDRPRSGTAGGGDVGRLPGPEARAGGRACLVPLLAVLLFALSGAGAGAAGQVLLTQEEALELAFPDPATVERRSAFLDDAQLERARELAGEGVEVDQNVVTHYVATRDGRAVGVAYFDVHRVRTMREVVMVVVAPGGTVERVEVLRFAEPPDYLASEQWIAQLEGRELDEELEVGRGIVNMTGATLTSGALTRAARRVLALHRVIDPLGTQSATGGHGR